MVSKSCPQLVDLGFAFLPRLGLSKRIRAARASPNSSQALTPRAAPPAWLQKLGENPAFLSKSGSARSRASSPVININRDDAHQFQPGCRGAMLSLGMGNYVNFVDYPFMCSLSRGRAARCRRWVPSGCGCPLAAPPESSGELSCSSSSSAGEEGEIHATGFEKAKPGPESCQICDAEDGAQGSAASSRGFFL